MYIPQSFTANNVCCINDIVNNVGNFISYNQFCDKFGKIIPYFQYISLIDDIPAMWRYKLKQQKVNSTICNI